MNNFTIISFNEAETLISQEKLSIWKQDESNLSLIYKRKDSTILCLPIKGNKAVIFLNFEVMDFYFKSSGIPIHSNNLFAQSQNIISKWEENFELIRTYEAELKCNIDFPLKRNDIIKLGNVINYYFKNVLNYSITADFFIFVLAVIGNQIISINDDIKWGISKEYDINPISIPILINKDNEYLISSFLIKNILKRKIDFINVFNQIYSSYKLEYSID